MESLGKQGWMGKTMVSGSKGMAGVLQAHTQLTLLDPGLPQGVRRLDIYPHILRCPGDSVPSEWDSGRGMGQ